MAGTAFPTREGMSPAPRRTVGAGCGNPRVTGLTPLVNATTAVPSDRWMSVPSQGGEALDPLRLLVPCLHPVDVPGHPGTVERGQHAADGVRRPLEDHLDPAVRQVLRGAGHAFGLGLRPHEP